ncbi:hypothetical protein CURTO8I2_210094 [Curtobacterium sp. 8I-2]|nr:hypothetical protein CURTO8I2_210094 [Curtobacterium sp. 8I-2]
MGLGDDPRAADAADPRVRPRDVVLPRPHARQQPVRQPRAPRTRRLRATGAGLPRGDDGGDDPHGRDDAAHGRRGFDVDAGDGHDRQRPQHAHLLVGMDTGLVGPRRRVRDRDRLDAGAADRVSACPPTPPRTPRRRALAADECRDGTRVHPHELRNTAP